LRKNLFLTGAYTKEKPQSRENTDEDREPGIPSEDIPGSFSAVFKKCIFWGDYDKLYRFYFWL
jgi:hypothetical protein